MGFFMIYRVRKKSGVPAVQRAVPKKENGELLQLKRMRERSLSVPLSEITRPTRLEDIVGQQEGIKALRAALCGPNPQHVLIYGPPGIGKTCAARLVLEEAKKCPDSPFNGSLCLLRSTRPASGLTSAR
jgi:Lon-like ATP-dependent protease